MGFKGFFKLSARQIVRKIIAGKLDKQQLSMDQEDIVRRVKQQYRESGLGPRKFVDCWDWGVSASYIERMF